MMDPSDRGSDGVQRDVPDQFSYYHINVPDYGVPTESQIDSFLDLMDRHHRSKEAVVIHCVAGCGRTGQFIVAWSALRHLAQRHRDFCFRWRIRNMIRRAPLVNREPPARILATLPSKFRLLD